MKIAVFGGSGFIGRNLVGQLALEGAHVILVSRSRRSSQHGERCATWEELERDASALEGCDAFVNLTGETINQRWSKEGKRRILQSRLDAVERIGALIDMLDNKPEALVSSSGMSIYGYSDTDTFDERSGERLTDFLADTVHKWEQAVDRIQGVRIVKLRIGLVLGMDGGAFPPMSLPFRMFVGGRVGSGKQVHSWIHISDMIGIIRYCIDHRDIVGAVNCTAPHPATNDEFGRALAAAAGRPYWMPVPSFMLKLLFGEMSELLLKGQRVLPHTIVTHGYTFRYPELEAALQQLLRDGRNNASYIKKG